MMKTTVEVPDALYRQAKAETALRGRKLKDLIQEGLRLVLEAPRKTPRHIDDDLAVSIGRDRGVE
jgi:hypothetical protein